MELEQLRKGDKKLIETLYKECFPGISSWVMKNSGTQKEAEDVFQDALVAVFKRSKDASFELNCKLSTFIFGVAKKTWLYRLRTRDRHVFTDFTQDVDVSDQDGLIIEQLIDEEEVDAVYKRNFRKLTTQCQQILSLFFNGHAMKEIVTKMGLANAGLARKKKFNCKNELVRLVKEDPLYIELVEK
ncbi:MAG: sigma-70 family RNA polymerase sigma factor [Bacteroidota bacterium]